MVAIYVLQQVKSVRWQHNIFKIMLINDLAERHDSRLIMQGEPNLCLYANPKYMLHPCPTYLKALKEQTH